MIPRLARFSADGVDGADGDFVYGPASAFPTQTWQSTNYWVDIVFATIAPPSDGGCPLPPSGGGSGGRCGSAGLDLLAPLALLWGIRRVRGRRISSIS